MVRPLLLAASMLLTCLAACGDDATVDPGGSAAGQSSDASVGGAGTAGAAGAAGASAAAGAGGEGGAAGSAGSAGAAAGAGSAGAAGAAGAGPCTDAYPYTDGYTCAQQAGWGKCGEAWMLGACDISCGRCGGGPACASLGADPCAFSMGLPHACRFRFALGINFAWRSFGADFGGIPKWNQKSVSQAPAVYDADLAKMRASGASVVRWWMFPELRADGIEFDTQGNPTGISDTLRADILKALELAAKHDLHLVLTLFSFDNFRPDREVGGLLIRSAQPLLSDPARRAILIENVVRPVAATAAQSPHIANLLGWDLINEPEWAIAPESGVALADNFTPLPELKAVPLPVMKAFLKEALPVLGQETPSALKSIGWAAAKWAWAFGDIAGVDFHQPHIYAWVNAWYPFTTKPGDLGYPAGKPTVMGECYLKEMPFSPVTTGFATIAETFFQNGYAGFWPWDYYSGNVQDPPDSSFALGLLKSFADQKGCQATYESAPPAPPPPAQQSLAEAHATAFEREHWEALGRWYPVDRKRALEHALQGEPRLSHDGTTLAANDAMVITLLADVGRMPEARARAHRFLTRNPGSPYAPLVRGVTGIHPRPSMP